MIMAWRKANGQTQSFGAKFWRNLFISFFVILSSANGWQNSFARNCNMLCNPLTNPMLSQNLQKKQRNTAKAKLTMITKPETSNPLTKFATNTAVAEKERASPNVAPAEEITEAPAFEGNQYILGSEEESLNASKKPATVLLESKIASPEQVHQVKQEGGFVKSENEPKSLDEISSFDELFSFFNVKLAPKGNSFAPENTGIKKEAPPSIFARQSEEEIRISETKAEPNIVQAKEEIMSAKGAEEEKDLQISVPEKSTKVEEQIFTADKPMPEKTNAEESVASYTEPNKGPPKDTEEASEESAPAPKRTVPEAQAAMKAMKLVELGEVDPDQMEEYFQALLEVERNKMKEELIEQQNIKKELEEMTRKKEINLRNPFEPSALLGSAFFSAFIPFVIGIQQYWYSSNWDGFSFDGTALAELIFLLSFGLSCTNGLAGEIPRSVGKLVSILLSSAGDQLLISLESAVNSAKESAKETFTSASNVVIDVTIVSPTNAIKEKARTAQEQMLHTLTAPLRVPGFIAEEIKRTPEKVITQLSTTIEDTKLGIQTQVSSAQTKLTEAAMHPIKETTNKFQSVFMPKTDSNATAEAKEARKNLSQEELQQEEKDRKIKEFSLKFDRAMEDFSPKSEKEIQSKTPQQEEKDGAIIKEAPLKSKPETKPRSRKEEEIDPVIKELSLKFDKAVESFSQDSKLEVKPSKPQEEETDPVIKELSLKFDKVVESFSQESKSEVKPSKPQQEETDPVIKELSLKFDKAVESFSQKSQSDISPSIPQQEDEKEPIRSFVQNFEKQRREEAEKLKAKLELEAQSSNLQQQNEESSAKAKALEFQRRQRETAEKLRAKVQSVAQSSIPQKEKEEPKISAKDVAQQARDAALRLKKQEEHAKAAAALAAELKEQALKELQERKKKEEAKAAAHAKFEKERIEAEKKRIEAEIELKKKEEEEALKAAAADFERRRKLASEQLRAKIKERTQAQQNVHITSKQDKEDSVQVLGQKVEALQRNRKYNGAAGTVGASDYLNQLETQSVTTDDNFESQKELAKKQLLNRIKRKASYIS